MSISHFQFKDNEVRALEIDGDPWFIARDIAETLGYKNPSEAVSDHCKRMILLKTSKSRPWVPPRGYQIIPESDVYRLIMRSDMPNAEQFQDWVCEEVLPSIRKTGSYSVQPAAPIPRIELYEREAAVCERFYDLSERCADPILRVMLIDRAKNTLSSDSQAALPNPDGAPFQTYQILEGLGYSSKEIRKLAPSAGKRLKAAYRNLAGREPEQIDRIVDGAARPVNVFPESFREDAQAVLAEWLAA